MVSTLVMVCRSTSRRAEGGTRKVKKDAKRLNNKAAKQKVYCLSNPTMSVHTRGVGVRVHWLHAVGIFAVVRKFPYSRVLAVTL